MEDSRFSFTLSSLLCQETEACLDEEVDEDSFFNLKNYTASDTEEEFVEMLIHRENSFRINKHEESCSSLIEDWIKCARLDAIRWVLKTRAAFGFGFQTAYLSVTYFDRFLLRRAIDSEKLWAIRLLSVACLSLAAKMGECKVPALSEFRVEDYSFESRVIQRMELLVLSTLEWKMNSITPFAFIHYFITKLCKESAPNKIVSRTVELILVLMKEINLMDHQPSIIAAAAALVALEWRLTRSELESKISSISSCGFLEIENVYSLYNQMQQIGIEKPKIPNFVVSPELSPTHLSKTSAFENSSVTSAVRIKRRRLAFNDCDKNYGISDEKRLQ